MPWRLSISRPHGQTSTSSASSSPEERRCIFVIGPDARPCSWRPRPATETMSSCCGSRERICTHRSSVGLGYSRRRTRPSGPRRGYEPTATVTAATAVMAVMALRFGRLSSATAELRGREMGPKRALTTSDTYCHLDRWVLVRPNRPRYCLVTSLRCARSLI